MKINQNKLLNSLLCCNKLKIPINNTHYITGKDLYLFSNFVCIENTLTDLTCNIKNICNNLKHNINR